MGIDWGVEQCTIGGHGDRSSRSNPISSGRLCRLGGKLELAKASRKKSRSSLEPIQRSMYCCLADRNVPRFPRKVWCKTKRLCYGDEYVCDRPPAPANV
jgi:hypothetical protein